MPDNPKPKYPSVLESSGIAGEVQAQSVVVSGELIGDCHASHRVEIQATGRLTGNIGAPRVVIAEGATFRPPPHRPRSTAGVGGETGVKNLRNRARRDSPATNVLIASQSAADAPRIWTPPRWPS